MIPATAEYLEQEAQSFGATPAVQVSLRLTPDDAWVVLNDVEFGGSIASEIPVDFTDLVCGSLDGLVLSNRQGACVDGSWVPAPVYSPNKSSFIFAGNNWDRAQIKIELGWDIGGWFKSGFLEDEFLGDALTDFITIFLGQITKWGPVTRGMDQTGHPVPVNVEIIARDWVNTCLQRRIALPGSDGNPQPLTFGEFLCKADKIVGWTPVPPIVTVGFETGDFSELDGTGTSGGGAVSIITPGLEGDYAMRAVVNGTNQAAYGEIVLPSSDEIFATGLLRFNIIPDALETGDEDNFDLIRLVDDSDNVIVRVTMSIAGFIATISTYFLDHEISDFDVHPFLGTPVTWSLWLKTGRPGSFYLWLNGDEVRKARKPSSIPIYVYPTKLRLGAWVGARSENWSIDFDSIEVGDTYYQHSFKVEGGPFASIGAVYSEEIVQPLSKLVHPPDGDACNQVVIRRPEYGIVTFNGLRVDDLSTSAEYEPPSDIMFRVIEHSGGRHALEIIESLLADAGLTDLVDPVSLAAAYIATTNYGPENNITDIINARFEGGGSRDKVGLKDYSNFGMTTGDAIKEICSRMLYWLFVDDGKIKIVPYLGAGPGSPAMDLDGSNLYEATQVIDKEAINDFVVAKFGWYDRNPSLFYVAGTPVAGGLGSELDFTWQSMVACENRDLVKAKADLLKIFLSAQEIIDPTRLGLAGARLELMQDAVSLTDELLNDAATNYFVARKEISLDPTNYEVSLQLLRILGE